MGVIIMLIEILTQFSGIFWTGIGMLIFWAISQSYRGLKREKEREVEDKINAKATEVEEKEKKNNLELEQHLSQKILDNKNDIANYHKDFQKRCSEMNGQFGVLQAGVLRVAGRWFIGDCQSLLEPDHVITQDEFEDIIDYHTTYNNLGGNHKGDEYFNLVSEKFHKQTGVK